MWVPGVGHAVPEHHISRFARDFEPVRVLGQERAPRDVRLRQRVRYRRVRAATRGAGLELAARLGEVASADARGEPRVRPRPCSGTATRSERPEKLCPSGWQGRAQTVKPPAPAGQSPM